MLANVSETVADEMNAPNNFVHAISRLGGNLGL